MSKSNFMDVEKLAVIIPVYNNPNGLRITLDSIHDAQKPDGFITIVIDDGSTIPIVSAEKDISIGVVLIRLEQNRGIEFALNAGLKEAHDKGMNVIARIVAGDTVRKDRFHQQMKMLHACPEVGLVGTGARFIDECGRDIFTFSPPEEDHSIRKRMHINSCILHPSAMFRLSVIDVCGGYSTSYPAAEDYELFFRMLKHARASCIREPLINVVVKNNCISIERRTLQILSRIRIQVLYFDPYIFQSYVGIIMSFFLLLIPNNFLFFLKRRFKRWSY